MRPDQARNRAATRFRVTLRAELRLIVNRFLLVAAFFSIAFAIDQLTG